LILMSSVGLQRDGGHEKHPYLSTIITKPIKPAHLYDALMSSVGGLKSTPSQRSGNPSRLTALGANVVQIAPEHPLRILLAEDSAVNQKVILLLLQRIGYRADVAANGMEVLEALTRQSYDVVLMDVQMPDMDGVEATQRIMQGWPRNRRPRIIAMTAHALPGDRERYIGTGMDDYISKPVKMDELIEALRKSQPLNDVVDT
jgi:CheY-like chemotaxis protein